MTVAPVMHPWVAAHWNRISFALQVEARRDDPAPGRSVLAAGQLAEELGFDAFLAADHPSWQSEPWLHLAALAVSTERIGLGTMVSSVLYRPPVLTARLMSSFWPSSADRLGRSGHEMVTGRTKTTRIAVNPRDMDSHKFA